MLAMIEGEKPEEEKLADGFVRSKRNLEMRAREEVDSSVAQLEGEKEALIRKLNEALLKLD